MRSNDKTDLKYESINPENPRKHMLISTGGENVEKLIFKMAEGGGHLGFEGQNEVE